MTRDTIESNESWSTQETTETTTTIDTIPDGGYGWVCVFACFQVNVFTWGVVASNGVYLAYYINNDVFSGGSSFHYAIIASLGFSAAMAVAPAVTALVGRLDIHIPMLIGIVLQTGGLIGASFAQEIWQLYLAQGVLVGFGIGCTFIPTMGVLAQWFSKRRSLVYGIAASGMGVGGLIFSFGARWLTRDLGLSWSLRITGVVSCLVNLLATGLIKSRNGQVLPSHDSFDTKLLCRYDVFLHLCFAFVSMLAHTVVLFSLSDFGHSIGLTEGQAASMTAFLNLGIALGRPFIGILSDRFGRIETAGTLTLICGLTIFAFWLPATSYWGCILFAFMNGPVFGVYWVTVGPISAELVGLVKQPCLLSLNWVTIVLPLTFTEVIGLYLRRPDARYEFLFPQIYAGTAYIVAGLLMMELRRVHRRRTSQVV